MAAETVLADRPERPERAAPPVPQPAQSDTFDVMDGQMRRFTLSMRQLSDESRRFSSDTETVHRLARMLRDALNAARR
ncbi:hypothetical protein FKB34_00670 [Glycocaulis profundi]|nr:hypothetical protein FKB34_00670 [Glycocaulis profundi]